MVVASVPGSVGSAAATVADCAVLTVEVLSVRTGGRLLACWALTGSSAEEAAPAYSRTQIDVFNTQVAHANM